MRKLIVLIIALSAISIVAVVIIVASSTTNTLAPISPSPTQAPTPTPTIILAQPTINKILNNDYHTFQSFNNCGPAALSMALSYYRINETQQKLGQDLRPYQVPG